VPTGYYEIPLGEPAIRREGSDVTMVTIGATLYRALEAADILQEKYGLSAEVIDARFINPLNYEKILQSVRKTGRCVLTSDASERASFLHTMGSNITQLAFDFLDGRSWSSAQLDYASGRTGGRLLPTADLDHRRHSRAHPSASRTHAGYGSQPDAICGVTHREYEGRNTEWPIPLTRHQKCNSPPGCTADYAHLGATVQELESAGVDWIHIEVRDGKYMDFGMPRGGFDIIEAARASTSLEIEAQLQMMRPGFDVFRQLKELGVSLISLPIETMGEMMMQSVTYIKETLDLKVGVWAWQGTPAVAFEQYIHPYVSIVEYESRAPFWVKPVAGRSPHTIDPIVAQTVRRLHDMIAAAGMEDCIELMEDGGLNAANVEQFIAAGMTVGEFSSPLLKGPNGKFKPGTGEITAAAQKLRAVMDSASDKYRGPDGLKASGEQVA
jgi:pentose-5-phosphate-3-epimerase